MDSSGPKYFITFIDNYSRSMYLYILHSKDEALDSFKLFKAEVEKQCGRQIKIVWSDRGRKYHGRYMKNGQAPGLFAKFLQEHEIVAQHTMPGSPDQNGVAERKNRILMDTVRSMRSNKITPSILMDWSTKDDCVYIKSSTNQGCLKYDFWVIQMLKTGFVTYTCLGMPVWSENLKPTRKETRPKDHQWVFYWICRKVQRV